jgi:hypothetical protein
MTLVSGALAIGATVATPAAAAPPANGCATGNRASDVDHGMLLLVVAELTTAGYRVPAIVDDPANGGNGDGFVCGVPQGHLKASDGVRQLYLFFDNQFGPA